MTSHEPIASFSDLQIYAQCHRHWWLRTYRRLRPKLEPRTGALAFGARMHLALEQYYKGEQVNPVTAYDHLMAEEYALRASGTSGASEETLDEENRLGRVMLDGYLDWEAEQGLEAKYEVVAVEKPLSDTLEVALPEYLPGGGGIVQVLVRGKIDRLLRRRADDTVFINDFKTAARFDSTTLSDLSRSPQPRLYLALEKNDREREGDSTRVAGVIYTLLRKVLRTARSTPPYYLNHEVPIGPGDLAAYERRLRGSVGELVSTSRALDAGADPHEVAYFHVGWWCSSCVFRAPCSLYQDSGEEAAEQMLANDFVEHDPWERYSADSGE